MKSLMLVCVLLLSACSQIIKPAPVVCKDDVYKVKLNLAPLPPLDTSDVQTVKLRLVRQGDTFVIVMTQEDYFKIADTVDAITGRVGALQIQLDQYKNFYEGASKP